MASVDLLERGLAGGDQFLAAVLADGLDQAVAQAAVSNSVGGDQGLVDQAR